MITWEFATMIYGVSENALIIMSCINPKLCNYDRKLVYNFWESK